MYCRLLTLVIRIRRQSCLNFYLFSKVLEGAPLLFYMEFSYEQLLWSPNSPVLQWFSPSGEQPKLRVLTHTLWQPTSGCIGGGWGCEVSCGGHHRPRGKTTTGSALDGAVFDILNTGLSSTQYEQIPIILGVWPFWLTPFFFRSITFWRAYG